MSGARDGAGRPPAAPRPHLTRLLLAGLLLGGSLGLALLPGPSLAAPREPEPLEAPAEPPPLVEPTAPCPDLGAGGAIAFQSAGLEREVLLLLPPSPEPDLPVVIVFHGLGATAESMIPRLRLDRIAEEGAIVVVPRSHPSAPLTWGAGDKGVGDLSLYDDLRTCLAQQHDVDLRRLVASGFSAGGLWSSILASRRGATLAGVVGISGGVLPPFLPYRKAGSKLAVAALWGGPRDIFANPQFFVRFQQTTIRWSRGLRREGHAVVHCRHGQGHAIAPLAADVLQTWVSSVSQGGGLPLSTLPEGCWEPTRGRSVKPPSP